MQYFKITITYWNEDIHRFANIFKLDRVSVDNIQSAVKTVKTRTNLSANAKCNTYNTLLSADDMLSQVKAVELELIIESYNQINKTLTKEELQTAGQMFLYLNTCPYQNVDWIRRWRWFYDYLFLTQPTDQIILSLNRMMKTKTPEDMDATVRAEKLLKRTSSLIGLSFEKIQTLLPGKNPRNESFTIKDPMIQSFGTHSSDNLFCLYHYQIYFRFT